jgi:hypothetical protein
MPDVMQHASPARVRFMPFHRLAPDFGIHYRGLHLARLENGGVFQSASLSARIA